MMVQERKNRLMAYRVEKGLMVQKQVSTKAAATYLATYGVPMDVSVRVLTSNNKRPFEEYAEGNLWFDIIRGSGMTFGS
jgi:2-keto-4-pentenoate hydratase/2-oxohepta-3-ene-1,7-dioic acid hydratase in catechol pathway